MQVTRVYSDHDGETHAEDLEVPMQALGDGFMSQLIDLSGVYFRTTEFDGPKPFHNARWRHFCVPLVGGFELECSDGTKRRIVPGSILLAEDVDGRGHASVEIDPPRLTLFLLVPDDFDASAWKRSL